MDSVSAKRVSSCSSKEKVEKLTGSDRGGENGLAEDASGCTERLSMERLACLEVEGCRDGVAVGGSGQAPDEVGLSEGTNCLVSEHGWRWEKSFNGSRGRTRGH